MPKPRLLLVGWDAADWKVINPLVERGEMPGVAQFIEQGVMADMQTLQPILSPMLWNSIATGKRADKHGILGFTEVDPQSGRVRPSMSTSRRVKAVWNIFTQLGYRTHIINWFAGHPAEPINGICISDAYARGFPPRSQPFPLVPGTVRPERLAKTFEDL
ncbi:MAG TPA: alkaline phosphatase family protein, partial [Bryobacteraceae bacterium]|nr:alkaline phosphatase family protein [Bryobacteraceae bacterium]